MELSQVKRLPQHSLGLATRSEDRDLAQLVGTRLTGPRLHGAWLGVGGGWERRGGEDMVKGLKDQVGQASGNGVGLVTRAGEGEVGR